MSLRSNVPNGGSIEKTVKEVADPAPGNRVVRNHVQLLTDTSTDEDKQKRLLEQPNTGHFNMVRALHLADLITLLNGTIHSLCFSAE